MKIPLIYLNHIEKERCYKNAFDKKLKLHFVNFVGKLSRSCSKLFCNYYKQWIEVYKRDAVREATMAKYQMTWKWVAKLVPQLKISELTRTAYQQLLNDYDNTGLSSSIEGGFLPTHICILSRNWKTKMSIW